MKDNLDPDEFKMWRSAWIGVGVLMLGFVGFSGLALVWWFWPR